MANSVLKKDVLKTLKTDPVLFGQVAEHLGTTVRYGLEMLNNNHSRLTQIDVLKIIATHMKCEIEELLEPELMGG